MMCRVAQSNRISACEMLTRLSLKITIDECSYVNLLRWYGHVARRPDKHLLKEASKLVVSGSCPRCRPRKTWDATVKEIMETRRVTFGCPRQKGLALAISGAPRLLWDKVDNDNDDVLKLPNDTSIGYVNILNALVQICGKETEIGLVRQVVNSTKYYHFQHLRISIKRIIIDFGQSKFENFPN